MSVIDYVDKILVWDTGSTDNTIKIINEIKKRFPKKVSFKQVGKVDINEFTKVRQEMLEMTKGDWFIIVDGDEVWWNDSIKTHTHLIKEQGKNLETLVTPYYNLIGDIYHHQEERAGQYRIDSKQGFLNIRFINTNISGLHYDKPHGQLAIVDSEGNLIQERRVGKRLYVNKHYLHFTNMKRSASLEKDKDVVKRSFKYKYEIGKSFAKDFFYPEVFFIERPAIVPSPWEIMERSYMFRALMQTSLKSLKRRIYQPSSSGY